MNFRTILSSPAKNLVTTLAPANMYHQRTP